MSHSAPKPNPTPQAATTWTNIAILLIAALVALAAGFGAGRATPTPPPADKPTAQPAINPARPSPTPAPPSPTPQPTATPIPERLSLADLQRLLQEPLPPLVVDVRTSDSFAQGHIPGAINLPLNEINTRFKELPANRLIVTYCA